MPELDNENPGLAEVEEDQKVRVAHRRLREVLDRHRDGRDGEDPSDPMTVQVMPMVLEILHDPLPARRAMLEAAASACVAVCLDPRAGEESGEEGSSTGTFAEALMSWYGARIRKIARRARNKKWRDVQALPGVTVEVDGARARAFTPCPVSQTPPLINRLQIEGTDLVDSPVDTAEAVSEDIPVIYVDASLGMSVGKAAAQVAHGSMLLAAEMSEDAALSWADEGFPLQVREVDRQLFAEVRAQAEMVQGQGSGIEDSAADYAAVVQDAGYTEVAPGSVTVVALGHQAP